MFKLVEAIFAFVSGITSGLLLTECDLYPQRDASGMISTWLLKNYIEIGRKVLEGMHWKFHKRVHAAG